VKLGSLIADAIGLPTDWKFTASMLLHDIGKIGIPDSILKKPTALSEEEWEIMKEHPEYGAKLLGQHGTHREVSEIILAHHERFDGTGYPRGLKGPEIPVIARIIAIAGAFHVMTNSQPYRAALAPIVAVKELIRNRGTQFDPKLVDVFIQGLVQLRIINKNDL
jgi:HD-GYP domain-containing protein (c-di-GMP phosphodiesterase class II)